MTEIPISFVKKLRIALTFLRFRRYNLRLLKFEIIYAFFIIITQKKQIHNKSARMIEGRIFLYFLLLKIKLKKKNKTSSDEDLSNVISSQSIFLNYSHVIKFL